MPATITATPARPTTAHERITAALAKYGITAHHDEDAGNSWLLISLTGYAFPALGVPHLVAYVYEAHEDWVFVDEPMEHWAGTWRVRFNNGSNEEELFLGASSDPETETAECAAFIAGYLAASRA